MREHEARLRIRLTPRGGSDRVDGVAPDGGLLVRVAAPPVADAANRALLRLLAHELDVSPTAVRLVGGAKGRVKLVAIAGVAAPALLARWPGLRL